MVTLFGIFKCHFVRLTCFFPCTQQFKATALLQTLDFRHQRQAQSKRFALLCSFSREPSTSKQTVCFRRRIFEPKGQVKANALLCPAVFEHEPSTSKQTLCFANPLSPLKRRILRQDPCLRVQRLADSKQTVCFQHLFRPGTDWFEADRLLCMCFLEARTAGHNTHCSPWIGD